MSGKCLPATVLVRKLLEQRACLQGEVPAAELPRLAEAVLGLATAVSASLQFGVGEDGHAYCDASVSVDVLMQCQRCLEPVTVALRTESRLRLIDELESTLAKTVEPVLLDKGSLNLVELVEEELLLALPIIARNRAEPDPAGITGEDGFAVNIRCIPGVVSVEELASVQGQGITDSTDKPGHATGGVTRRSEIGEDNPFNVLQSLKESSAQEQNHGSSKK